jgi:hypothetical protein
MANDVGRPSVLEDKEFLLRIRDLVLDYKSEVEMQEILQIPKGTWNTWKYTNFHNFSDIMLTYKHERIIRKAEANLEVLMESEDERVVADITKFSLETLGKSNYSKKTESDIRVKEMPKPILSGITQKEDGN